MGFLTDIKDRRLTADDFSKAVAAAAQIPVTGSGRVVTNSGPNGTTIVTDERRRPVVEIRIGMIVDAGPLGAEDNPDYEDERYWVRFKGIESAPSDEFIEFYDATNEFPDDFIVTASNLAEWADNDGAGGTHLLATDGTVVVLAYLWHDDNGTERWVFELKPSDTLFGRLGAESGGYIAWTQQEPNQDGTWTAVSGGEAGTTSDDPAFDVGDPAVFMLRDAQLLQPDGTYLPGKVVIGGTKVLDCEGTTVKRSTVIEMGDGFTVEQISDGHVKIKLKVTGGTGTTPVLNCENGLKINAPGRTPPTSISIVIGGITTTVTDNGDGTFTYTLPTTDVTVVTAVQVDTATMKLQIKTRSIKVISAAAESGWTDVHTGRDCDA